MNKPSDENEEAQLVRVAQRLLAMPHKPREESKIGKGKGKKPPSPRSRKPSISAKRRSAAPSA